MKGLHEMLGLMLLLAGLSHGEVKLGEQTTVAFADVEKGKQIVSARDDFIERLSPFDRAARMKTDKEVSEEEFLKFVAENVLPWQQDEQAKVESVLLSLAPKWAGLSIPCPKTVYFIRTTGKEEGNAAYTRDSAVVLPASMLTSPPAEMQRLICHELFHVVSRNSPKLRESLYQVIGFLPCGEIELPPTLKARKITNPDAPRNDHCLQVKVDDKPLWVVPILVSRTAGYDLQRGGEFFQYMQFHLLAVARSEDGKKADPIFVAEAPQLLDVEQVSGFYEQVGRNSAYIIHPEETLGDNFVLLVLGDGKVRSPEIIEKMKKVFAESTPAGANTPKAPQGQ